MTYKRVELSGGEPVQFVGVHAVKWRPEWGAPTVGFIEDDDPVRAAAPELVQAASLAISAIELALSRYDHLMIDVVRLALEGAGEAAHNAIAKARGEATDGD